MPKIEIEGRYAPSIDVSGSARQTRSRLNELPGDISIDARGIGGDPLYESVPEYDSTQTEKIYRGNNNAWIILGRDRPEDSYSGYGGKGHTKTGRVDIIAGLGGYSADAVDETGQQPLRQPSFDDATRLYCSAKADIDDYMGICAGSIGQSVGKSALGMIGDAVRIYGREGVKIVTQAGGKNSRGGDINGVYGIDLIAGNDDSGLEPIPKGNKLGMALQRMIHHLDKLNGIVDSLLMAQMRMNEALTDHFHISPFYAQPTTPSETVVAAGTRTMQEHLTKTKRSLTLHKQNLEAFKQTFLKESGKNYINSRQNNTN